MAATAIETHVGRKLGLGLHEAAAAVMSVATENMVHAVEDITVNQGIDPREAVIVGGGGAAGLNAVALARRLGCKRVILPEVAAALSAHGALISDLRAEYGGTLYTSTADFDFNGVNALLESLEEKCRAFVEGPGAGSREQAIEFTAEARYPSQIWEIEVPLRGARIEDRRALERFVEDFHRVHEELFAFADEGSAIEAVGWRANVRCRLRDGANLGVEGAGGGPEIAAARAVYFPEAGRVEARVARFERMAPGETVAGPAIVESSFTTVVIDPGAVAERRASGSLLITP